MGMSENSIALPSRAVGEAAERHVPMCLRSALPAGYRFYVIVAWRPEDV
jgi:hypothetical protein